MHTSQDVKINFMHYGEIVVPKGTRVTHETATGIDTNYHFVDTLHWVKLAYPDIAPVLIHDMRYYGLNIPREYIVYE